MNTVVDTPVVRAAGAAKQQQSFAVEGNAPVFAGHFPGYPILPGVMLLALARAAASEACGQPLALRRIVRQRYTKAVLPDTVVTVEFELGEPLADSGDRKLSCRWKLPDGSLCARGELLVG